jgi:hypothetical protein
MDIYEIKEATLKKAPYFFSPNTLAFFHQSMKDFWVEKVEEGIYCISQDIRDDNGKFQGQTIRYFYRDYLYSTIFEAQAVKRQEGQET